MVSEHPYDEVIQFKTFNLSDAFTSIFEYSYWYNIATTRTSCVFHSQYYGVLLFKINRVSLYH